MKGGALAAFFIRSRPTVTQTLILSEIVGNASASWRYFLSEKEEKDENTQLRHYHIVSYFLFLYHLFSDYRISFTILLKIDGLFQIDSKGIQV